MYPKKNSIIVLLVMFLVFGIRTRAQNIFAGSYQKASEATELFGNTITTKNNGQDYGDLPFYFAFCPPSQEEICDFVYSINIVTRRNSVYLSDVSSESALTPAIKDAAINGEVKCANKLITQRFSNKNGSYYSGPFFAVDSNKLYASGHFSNGYLIDTLELFNYRTNPTYIFQDSLKLTDGEFHETLGKLDSGGKFVMIFKRILPFDTASTSCTNLAIQYFVKGQEYLMQAWTIFDTSNMRRYPLVYTSGTTGYLDTLHPTYDGLVIAKSYAYIYKRNSGNQFTVVNSGKNDILWGNIFRSTMDYKHYAFNASVHLNLNPVYSYLSSASMLSRYKGSYAEEWLSSIKEPESKLRFYNQSVGLSVFLDTNNVVIGAIYKPEQGNCMLRYFPDQTYKGKGIRFIRKDEAGISYFINVEDFQPIMQRNEIIKDVRQLLKAPNEFWGCKVCIP